MTAWARRGVPPLGAALLVLVIAGAAGATTVTFASAVTITLGSGNTPESVVIGDLNKDGTPDLAIANQHSNSVSVLLGIGTAPGTFQPKVDYTTGSTSGPVSVAIGDLNNDGTPDLAIANQGSNSVSVLLGIGTAPGTFYPRVDYSTGLGTFGSAPVSVAIGDLNRDGTPDLVTANQNDNAVSVLLGIGAAPGTFQAHADYATGSSFSLPASVAIGDLNHDGNPDVAVADSNLDQVEVLLGNGATPGATLQPHIDYAVGSDPHSVAIGDLNNDGTPDLATANCCANSVSVLRGVGNGTFLPRVNYTTGPGSSPYSVAIGDLNNDGTPDLATANTNTDNVSVLLGIGTAPGTFQAHTDYAVGDAPISVAIGDLDADGALDLAVANSVGNSFSVLFQRSAPGAPGSVSATAGNGQATVSFTTPPTNGGGPISSYTVTASPGNATATGAASPLTVAGLTNGTAYTFTVTATNGAGTGSASAASNTAIPGLPGAPTGVTATAANGQATVSFTAPPSNGSAITSYTVTASPGSATATGAASPLTVAGLSNGTAYTFTVTATNAVGTGSASAASNTITPVTAASSTTPPAQPATVQPATVDTIAPTPPAGLTGRFTNGALILRWQPSTDSVAIDHYELYLGGIPVQRIAGSVTQASVRIFNPAGTSLYTVRALDAAGNQSAVLAAVTVRPLGRPTSLPGRIPQWAWQFLAWQETGDDGARPKTPAKLPQWYARWKAWRLQPFRLAG
jgi:hypothetical protein